MGTTYSIKYEGSAGREEIAEVVATTLKQIDALFSTHDPQSEISRFNAHRSTAPFDATPEFAALVQRALEIAAKTDGAFDPTIMPVAELYGFGPGGRRDAPSSAEINAALASVGYTKLQVLPGAVVRKLDPSLRLDLNGIAPGHAVDRVGAALTAHGATGWMVEIGGEVRCAGTKSSGEPWLIGVEGPSEDGTRIAETVALVDAALSTSGSYRSYVEQAGRITHHVLDPRTGHNASNGIVIAAIIAPDCALADAVATALMVLGPERAVSVFDRIGSTGLAGYFLERASDGSLRTHKVRW
jgi:thiamine biosynthesis lipoprotein